VRRARAEPRRALLLPARSTSDNRPGSAPRPREEAGPARAPARSCGDQARRRGDEGTRNRKRRQRSRMRPRAAAIARSGLRSLAPCGRPRTPASDRHRQTPLVSASAAASSSAACTASERIRPARSKAAMKYGSCSSARAPRCVPDPGPRSIACTSRLSSAGRVRRPGSRRSGSRQLVPGRPGGDGVLRPPLLLRDAAIARSSLRGAPWMQPAAATVRQTVAHAQLLFAPLRRRRSRSATPESRTPEGGRNSMLVLAFLFRRHRRGPGGAAAHLESMAAAWAPAPRRTGRRVAFITTLVRDAAGRLHRGGGRIPHAAHRRAGRHRGSALRAVGTEAALDRLPAGRAPAPPADRRGGLPASAVDPASGDQLAGGFSRDGKKLFYCRARRIEGRPARVRDGLEEVTDVVPPPAGGGNATAQRRPDARRCFVGAGLARPALARQPDHRRGGPAFWLRCRRPRDLQSARAIS